jgi:hypothetical protein
LYEQTKEYLLMFFDGSVRMGRITRAMAADWRAAMARRRLVLNRKGKKNKEASVCIHVRNAKTAFNYAVREDLIMFNPFDRPEGMRKTAPKKEKQAASCDRQMVSAKMKDKPRATVSQLCPDCGQRDA